MVLRRWLVFLVLISWVGLSVTPAFGGEYYAWIRTEKCSVYEKPTRDSGVVGMIRQKAAVTVEEAGSGWVRILFAPVRDLKTGNFIDGSGRFIQKSDLTDVDACHWAKTPKKR
jgi:hypothetical protein